jgi:two-component system, NarL family, invasion response regulator UvrY
MKTSSRDALRILIVDDHAIVREGLARILEGTDRGWQVAEAASGFVALDWLRHHDASLVILDLSMPGMSGLDLIVRLRAEFPRLRVLVLSMHAEEQYAMRAFQAGAHGYVTKDRAPSELVDAVTKVVGGGAYVTASLAERMVQQMNGAQATPRHTQLSNRELEVLRRICAGRRLSDIANELHLSIKTISSHKRRIQDKLDAPSMAALIRYGMEHGLQESGPGSDTNGG